MNEEGITITSTQLWMLVSLFLAVLLVISVFTAGFGIVKQAPNNNNGNNNGNSNTGNQNDTTNNTNNNENNNGNNNEGLQKIPLQPTNNGILPRGQESAKVSIIIFDDFQCPFCERFFKGAESQIEQNYIETGKIKLYFEHFPLSFHPKARPAANAAMCANEQGKFWEMHDKLFENQQEWTNSADNEIFKQYAEDLGLNTDQFNECFDQSKYNDVIDSDYAYGAQGYVSGTPTSYLIVPKDMAKDGFEDTVKGFAKQYPQNIALAQTEDGNNYIVGFVGALPYEIFQPILEQINYE